MTGKISRRAGDHYTTIDLDDLSAQEIRLLGQVIAVALSKQDPLHWHNAGAVGVLPRMNEGARVLQRLGHRSGRALLLDDDGAHLAFVACCFMSLKAKALDPKMRTVLKQVIDLLADCCRIDVSIPSLPPQSSLPKSLQKSREIRRQYKLWQSASGGPHQVSISDAVILLKIFEKAGRPMDNKVIEELRNATEGLSMAMARLKQGKK